jgi:phosphonate transport system permease protein
VNPAAPLAAYPTRWRPPPAFGTRTRQRVAIFLALAYTAWAIHGLNVDTTRVLAGFGRAADLLARMIPPDFQRWELLLKGMTESLQMAFAATLAGVLLSVPLGIAAARNLAPRPVYLAARGFIVVGRTFHEIIIAIFFVKLFGFGPVAGLLTLAFASAIFLGKMLAEDIENVRAGPIEAVRATGAGFGQVVTYAVVPQVLTRSVGTAIYRLDANLRHSTVVGIVGAGGIGQTLSASFSRYDHDFAAAILLSIVALVALGEWFSDWVRRRMR